MKARKTRDARKPRDEVLAFIKHFEGARETFLHGCCYWFAHILSERFWLRESVAILYEPVEGHFITQIGGRYYDVRGDVTDLYRGFRLYTLDAMRRDGSAMYRHLMRDCRDFIDPEE